MKKTYKEYIDENGQPYVIIDKETVNKLKNVKTIGNKKFVEVPFVTVSFQFDKGKFLKL